MRAIARVPLSNLAAARELSRLIAAPKSSAFAPADRRWPGRRGSGSVSDGRGAEAAARAAPGGRLETIQKVLTRGPRPGPRPVRAPSAPRPRPVRAPSAPRQGSREARQVRARGQTSRVRHPPDKAPDMCDPNTSQPTNDGGERPPARPEAALAGTWFTGALAADRCSYRASASV